MIDHDVEFVLNAFFDVSFLTCDSIEANAVDLR